MFLYTTCLLNSEDSCISKNMNNTKKRVESKLEDVNKTVLWWYMSDMLWRCVQEKDGILNAKICETHQNILQNVNNVLYDMFKKQKCLARILIFRIKVKLLLFDILIDSIIKKNSTVNEFRAV